MAIIFTLGHHSTHSTIPKLQVLQQWEKVMEHCKSHITTQEKNQPMYPTLLALPNLTHQSSSTFLVSRGWLIWMSRHLIWSNCAMQLLPPLSTMIEVVGQFRNWRFQTGLLNMKHTFPSHFSKQDNGGGGDKAFGLIVFWIQSATLVEEEEWRCQCCPCWGTWFESALTNCLVCCCTRISNWMLLWESYFAKVPLAEIFQYWQWWWWFCRSGIESALRTHEHETKNLPTRIENSWL